MPVTIIFGGQYGSEGKGKVAHFFAVKEHAKYCVRVGGPNSGHTVYRGDEKLIFRILPTGAIENDVCAILPAGSYIDLNLLQQEIIISKISAERLLIDENAVIITERMYQTERDSDLLERIGSTQSGTGEAVINRILRRDATILAKNCPTLKPYLCDTKRIMRDACNHNEKIIIEGTQGFGLSLLHSRDYPYTTSRDTSAAAFLAETGLSPFDVDNIVMVIRAFPIRVSGKSGPLKNEITWDIIKKESNSSDDLIEFTSCTNRVRRVARFDAEIVLKSIIANKPNIIVLNHMDYVHTNQRDSFILGIERQINNKIDYLGFNPLIIQKNSR